MTDTHQTDPQKDALEERTEAATGSRTLDKIEEHEKSSSSSADSEVPSPDAPAADREADKDTGGPM